MSKPIQIPSLETERLVLRGPEPGDFALYRDFYATATGEGGYGGPLRPDEAFRRLAAAALVTVTIMPLPSGSPPILAIGTCAGSANGSSACATAANRLAVAASGTRSDGRAMS